MTSQNGASHINGQAINGPVNTRDASKGASTANHYRHTEDDVDPVVSMIRIQLMRGNLKAAREILDAFEKEITKEATRPENPLDIGLNELLDTRLANDLEKNFGAMYVRDVVNLTPEQVLAGRNLGQIALEKIQEAVRKVYDLDVTSLSHNGEFG